jgi:serine/threonine protein kinase
MCSGDLAELVGKMLDRNPKTRITAKGILVHDAIKERRNKFFKWYVEALQNK